MTDHVVIKGLRLMTRVGVTEAERSQPQGVVVDVDVETDLAPAGASDELADTVDYAALIASIAGVVRTGEAKLLESFAHRIAERVSEIKAATAVTVEISKEIVPIEENVEEVTVRIERQFV